MRRSGPLAVFLLFVAGAVVASVLARGGDADAPEDAGQRLAGEGSTPAPEVRESVAVREIQGAPSVCGDLGDEMQRQFGRVPVGSVSDVDPGDVQRAVARAVALSGTQNVAVLAVPLSGRGAGEETVDTFRKEAAKHHADTPIQEISSLVGGGGSDVAATPLKDVHGCSTVAISFGEGRDDELTYAIGVAAPGAQGSDFCASFDLEYLCDRPR